MPDYDQTGPHRRPRGQGTGTLNILDGNQQTGIGRGKGGRRGGCY